MAQDGVVKELLTDAMIEVGRKLTQRLDEQRWPVRASLWLYVSEGNQWKLILASPRVTLDGPKKSYETIQAALADTSSAEGTLALSDIGVMDPENPLIVLLGMAIKTGPKLGGIRFTRNVVNGHFIEDAYIYRLSDKAPTGEAA